MKCPVTDLEIDPITWFSQRELNYKPRHFILTKTPITTESKKWIYNKLRGRFVIVTLDYTQNDSFDDFDLGGYPAFEDPAEATFYELTWS